MNTAVAADLLNELSRPVTLPRLGDPATRERLAPAALGAIVRLAEIWKLNAAEVRALLGEVAERTWFRMKKPGWSGAVSPDLMTRISLLLGIYKNLRLIFSEPLVDEWVRLPNSGSFYAGRAPLQAMIDDGIPGMLHVRRHLEALRGGA